MAKVLITIDTELSAALHQQGVPLERNVACSIDGQVGSAAFGVGWQMDRMEEHGLKAVFFVDPMPALVYGPEYLAKMVRPILDRGHEVQLHIHTEWLAWAMVSPVGGRTGQNIGDFDFADQLALLTLARDLLEQAGVARPIAFRAGNYGADDTTLTVLAQLGMLYDSSFNVAYKGNPCRIGLSVENNAPVLRNAIVELPVSGLFDLPGHIRPAQVCALSKWEMIAALRHAGRQEHSTFVIVSHSFEMLSRDRLRPNHTVMARFSMMCREIARNPDLYSAGFCDLDPSIVKNDVPNPPRLGPGAIRTIERMLEQAVATIRHERRWAITQ